MLYHFDLGYSFANLCIFLWQYYNFRNFLISNKFLTGEKNSTNFLPCFIGGENYVNQQYHASIAAFSFLRKTKLYCNAITVLIDHKHYLPRYMPKHSATCTSLNVTKFDTCDAQPNLKDLNTFMYVWWLFELLNKI